MSSSPGAPPPPLYAALGVPATISPADLARQYKRLSLDLHPDRAAYRSGADDASEEDVKRRYQSITEAYETLSDPQRRAAYDAKHGVNFSTRLTALREAVGRCDGKAVAPDPKRHRAEVATGVGADPENSKLSQSQTDSEDDEEYVPGPAA